MASSRSRNPARWRLPSKSLRECSSTAATSPPTSSPTRTRMECVLEDVHILIHEKKISSMKDLLPLLEKSAKMGKPLLNHRRGR